MVRLDDLLVAQIETRGEEKINGNGGEEGSGDAVSDVTACRKAGVTCLSAAWGTTADIRGLEEANPSKVFFSIRDLSHFLLRTRENT